MLKIFYDNRKKASKPEIEQDFSCDEEFAEVFQKIIDFIIMDDIRMSPARMDMNKETQKQFIVNNRARILQMMNVGNPDMSYLQSSKEVNTQDSNISSLLFE